MANQPRNVVAIVDDDDAVRDSLRLLLEVIGWKTICFESGSAFLASQRSDVFCLLVDHHMPGMTGVELAAEVRSAGLTMPIMLLTGSLSPAILSRALAVGVDRVMEKPPDEDDLIEFVTSAAMPV